MNSKNNLYKFAFFLEEPYHYDFYKNIVNVLEKKNFLIVLNLFKNKNYFNVIEDLKKNKINYIKISSTKKVDPVSKFVITTLDSQIFFTFFLGVKFFFKKKSIFFKFLNKIRYKIFPIEKALGNKIIYFPRGMDIKKTYPSKIRINASEIFFCHSKVDKLIIDEQSKKEKFIIGYPRYNNISIPKNDNKIKKILLMPSPSDADRNKPYFYLDEFLKKLSLKNYNIDFTLKPHPLYKNLDFIKSHKLKFSIADDESDLYLLLKNHDLILCNNTGPFFSSIFNLKKTIIFHENKTNFHEKIQVIYDKYKHNYLVDINNFDKIFLDNQINLNFFINQNRSTFDFKKELYNDSPENSLIHTVNVLKSLKY